MQHANRFLTLALAAFFLAACAQDGGDTASSGGDSKLDTDAQKFGYSIGVDIGKSLGPVKDEVDLDALVSGLRESIDGKAPRIGDEEREKIKADISQKLQAKQREERDEKAKVAKAAGEKFLAENGKKEGVKTTDSGLQYQIIDEGSGTAPNKDDKVTVHYRGTLIDGTEFDSSYSRGQPVTFPLGNVIPGWTEGLQLMKPGGKAKLFIPSSLGYGERGAGAKIGPNETLVFEVELISVGEPEKKKAK